MASATEKSTRDRLVDVAIDLFSTQGYEATTVADIQLACGLTAGSGALYKHFPTKHALLEEVLDRHLNDITQTQQSVVAEIVDGLDLSAGNLEEVLRLGARLVWETIERHGPLVRITMRDLEPYPELLNRVWDGIFSALNHQATALINSVLESGAVDVDDPEATAAVLLASLTYFPILRRMIGRTPGDLDRGRYLDAWVSHALATLTSDA